MTLEEFIVEFANQFEDADVSQFKADTNFKDIEGWDSLTAVSIINMIGKKCGVRLLGGDLRGAGNIREVYEIIQQRSQ